MSPGGKLALVIAWGLAGLFAWAGVWLGVALLFVAGVGVIFEERSHG